MSTPPRIVTTVALGTLLALTGGMASSRTLEATGHALLEAKCASCHGIGRTDSSRHQAAPPFRVIARKYHVESLAEALAEGIVVGHPDMPEFVFQPDDIAAIMAYLTELSRQP
jgi:mono/diheme cytochrome c family protein